MKREEYIRTSGRKDEQTRPVYNVISDVMAKYETNELVQGLIADLGRRYSVLNPELTKERRRTLDLLTVLVNWAQRENMDIKMPAEFEEAKRKLEQQ